MCFVCVFCTPSPSVLHSELDSPSQQQARISASCATRELDELMASLSDFKVHSSLCVDRTYACPFMKEILY